MGEGRANMEFTEAYFGRVAQREIPTGSLVYVSAPRGMTEIEWIEIKAQLDLAYAQGKAIRLEVYP